MTSELKKCFWHLPVSRAEIQSFIDGFAVCCLACGARGPKAASESEAAARWNDPPRLDDPPPPPPDSLASKKAKILAKRCAEIEVAFELYKDKNTVVVEEVKRLSRELESTRSMYDEARARVLELESELRSERGRNVRDLQSALNRAGGQ